jgi:hypothetical protein
VNYLTLSIKQSQNIKSEHKMYHASHRSRKSIYDRIVVVYGVVPERIKEESTYLEIYDNQFFKRWNWLKKKILDFGGYYEELLEEYRSKFKLGTPKAWREVGYCLVYCKENKLIIHKS